jgi:hypothetical protein
LPLALTSKGALHELDSVCSPLLLVAACRIRLLPLALTKPLEVLLSSVKLQIGCLLLVLDAGCHHWHWRKEVHLKLIKPLYLISTLFALRCCLLLLNAGCCHWHC